MIIKIIGIFLMLPALILFIGAMIEDKNFGADVLSIAIPLAFVIGLMMLIFG